MRLKVAHGRVQLDLDDPALRLTRPQQAALATDREIAVTAGAGAGKTHTLATRYEALFLDLALAGSPDIDAVAVLTFTEKAAAEMAERCYTRLTSLAASARENRELLDGIEGPEGRPLGGHLVTVLDRLCDRFDGARIGTFHGFCAGVLREFPVETGTPLDTVLVEPVEAQLLQREALEEALLDHLEADMEGMGLLLDAFGSRLRLVEAGGQALARIDDLTSALRAHAVGERTIEQHIDAAQASPDQVARWLERVGIPTLIAVSRLTEPGGGTPFTGDVLTPAIAHLRRALPDDPIRRQLALFGRYRRCLDTLLSGDKLRTLTHPSVIGPKREWLDPTRYGQAKRALAVLAERAADWPERFERARELPTRADATLLAALGPFARWVLDAQARFEAALDARGAVDFSQMQRRAVRAVVEHPPVRDALSSRHRYLVVDEFQDTDPRQWELVRALGRPTGPSDRIFLVGDVKQAIYGFRGGDVTVFRAASAELGVEPVVLPHNFRSRPELIDWFNRVFPSILHPTPYEPLMAGRDEPGGTVSVVLGDREGPGDPEATAHLIAAEVLDPSGPYSDLGLLDPDRHPTPPVAILLRRRTNMAAFEEALRRRDVPYAVAQGVGFWSRAEVVDLVNAVHGLVTGDPASIVGALRSPLFELTDQQIQDLGSRGLQTFGRSEPADADTAATAREWSALRQRARVLSASQLVAELVDRGRAVWSSDRGFDIGRAEANGQRLVELARAFDARGGIHRCAVAFLDQVLAGTRASEAVLAPDRARVLLLTIHAAKGLEFPVVLVPEIDVPPRADGSPLSVGRPRGSWELAFPVSDEDADVQQRVRPGLLESVQRASREEDDAEYARLLYVAATRARDHLVLLGNHPRTTTGRRTSWVDALMDVLPASTRVRERTDVLELPVAEVAPPEPPPAPRSLVRRELPPASVELGPSGLDAFAECPARWMRRHVLGLPEHTKRTEERARVLAGLRGQVLHGLLEDGLTGDREVARRRWGAAVLEAGLSLDEVDAGLERLEAHLETTAASEALDRALRAPGHSEVAFRSAHGGVALRGQIDRIYASDDGWVVLDYKTEALRGKPETQAAAHRDQLLAYCWAADRILRANGQPGIVRGEILFTATGACVPIPWTEADRAELEALLEDVGRVAAQPWEAVERDVLRSAKPRPCDQCGYRGRGCRGRPG